MVKVIKLSSPFTRLNSIQKWITPQIIIILLTTFSTQFTLSPTSLTPILPPFLTPCHLLT